MPKKKKLSFLKILFKVLGTSALWIILVFIPAGMQIYQFFGGNVNMLNQLPAWVWFAPLGIYITYVVIRSIYQYRQEMSEYNSSNSLNNPISKKRKSNKADNHGIAMQDVNNSPVTTFNIEKYYEADSGKSESKTEVSNKEDAFDIKGIAKKICDLAEEFSAGFRHIRDSLVSKDENEEEKASGKNVYIIRQEKARNVMKELLEVVRLSKYHFDCMTELEDNIGRIAQIFAQYTRQLGDYLGMREIQKQTALPGTPLPYGNLENYMAELFEDKATRTFNEVDNITESITRMLVPYIRGENKNPDIIIAPAENGALEYDKDRDMYQVARMKIYNNSSIETIKCFATLQLASDIYNHLGQASKIDLIPSLGNFHKPDRIRWNESKYMNEQCEITIPPKDSRYIDVADTLGAFHYNLCEKDVNATDFVAAPLHTFKIRIDYSNGTTPKFRDFYGYIYAANHQDAREAFVKSGRIKKHHEIQKDQIHYLKMIFKEGDWEQNKDVIEYMGITEKGQAQI